MAPVLHLKDALREQTGIRAIRPAASPRGTSRKSRCDELPAAEAQPARLRPVEAVALAQARANSRTSSSKPAYRPRYGRSAHNCRCAQSRSWAPISFAPMRATKSRELQGRVSSSVSLVKRAVRPLLNRIGREKSNELVAAWHSSTAARRSCPGASGRQKDLRQFCRFYRSINWDRIFNQPRFPKSEMRPYRQTSRLRVGSATQKISSEKRRCRRSSPGSAITMPAA